MKYLKSFKIFEEIDTDYKAENEMSRLSSWFVGLAKNYESDLKSKGIKLISKNTQSSDDARKLYKDACDKLKSSDENTLDGYGIMQWTPGGNICQSFYIIAPKKAKEVLRKPSHGSNLKINYTEHPNFCRLEYYLSPNDASSIYMEEDGEVLYQWNDHEKIPKGKLA